MKEFAHQPPRSALLAAVVVTKASRLMFAHCEVWWLSGCEWRHLLLCGSARPKRRNQFEPLGVESLPLGSKVLLGLPETSYVATLLRVRSREETVSAQSDCAA